MNRQISEEIEKSIMTLAENWAEAEKNGDISSLEKMLSEDFLGIGPRGFILTKDQWLQRYDSHDLKYNEFRIFDVDARDYGDVRIAVCRQMQKGTYQDHEVDGEFRATLIFVKVKRHWLLVGLHLSPVTERH